tara:strand:+ start:41 stop:478 length:438 start_codon:yes stop_codon:yes gene_type:complete
MENFTFKKYKTTDYTNALQDYAPFPTKIQNCSDEDLVLCAEFLTIYTNVIGICHENIKNKKLQHLHMYDTENNVVSIDSPHTIVNVDQPEQDKQTHVTIMLENDFCRCELTSYSIKDQDGDTITMYNINTYDQWCSGITTYFYFK